MTIMLIEADIVKQAGHHLWWQEPDASDVYLRYYDITEDGPMAIFWLPGCSLTHSDRRNTIVSTHIYSCCEIKNISATRFALNVDSSMYLALIKAHEL